MERDVFGDSGACLAFSLAFLAVAASATALWLRSPEDGGARLMMMAAVAGALLAYSLAVLIAPFVKTDPSENRRDQLHLE